MCGVEYLMARIANVFSILYPECHDHYYAIYVEKYKILIRCNILFLSEL